MVDKTILTTKKIVKKFILIFFLIRLSRFHIRRPRTKKIKNGKCIYCVILSFSVFFFFLVGEGVFQTIEMKE